MDLKDDILDKLDELGYPENEVVLTLEEFFENNDNGDTIGVNIVHNKPSPQEFYEVLKHITDYPEVDAIYVRIADAEFPQEWFFSDTVYIVGELDIERITDITELLYPDEISEGWLYGTPVNIPKTLANKRVVSLWWD
jgi:hypothetical protein